MRIRIEPIPTDERRDTNDLRRKRCSKPRAARRVAAGLKVFVGAAPGVGKTYEMLQTPRARKKDGYDVVVGVVETHGRKETRGAARRARDRSPQAHRIQRAGARGDGPRSHHRPQPADRACRRAGAYQRARQPAPQALSGRRGAAGSRASTSTPRSTSSTSKASTTWSHKSRTCACARPSRIPCSIAPMRQARRPHA